MTRGKKKMAANTKEFVNTTIMAAETAPEVIDSIYKTAVPVSDAETARIYDHYIYPDQGQDLSNNNAPNQTYQFNLSSKWYDLSSLELELNLEVYKVLKAEEGTKVVYTDAQKHTYLALQNIPLAHIFKSIQLKDARGGILDDITDPIGAQIRALLIKLSEDPKVTEMKQDLTGFFKDANNQLYPMAPSATVREGTSAYAKRGAMAARQMLTIRDRLPLNVCDLRKPYHGKFQLCLTRASDIEMLEMSQEAVEAPNIPTVTIKEMKLWVKYYQPMPGAAQVPKMQIMPHQAFNIQRFPVADNQARLARSFISPRPPKLIYFMQIPTENTETGYIQPMRNKMCSGPNALKTISVRIAGVQYPAIPYDFTNMTIAAHREWDITRNVRDAQRPFNDFLRSIGASESPCNVNFRDWLNQYNIIAIDTSRTNGQAVENEGGETPVSFEVEWVTNQCLECELVLISITNVTHTLDSFGNSSLMP